VPNVQVRVSAIAAHVVPAAAVGDEYAVIVWPDAMLPPQGRLQFGAVAQFWLLPPLTPLHIQLHDICAVGPDTGLLLPELHN
jgi:hypothetical protein